MSDLEQAREAKRVLADRLRDDPRVVGIGLGRERDAYVVRVRLSEAVEEDAVPARLRVGPGPTEIPVYCEVVGPIRPQPEDRQG